MNLFKNKKTKLMAEVLEDGWTKADALMKKMNNYQGAELTVEVSVRVQPDNEPPYETKMKAGVLKCYLIKPGVHVLVWAEPGKQDEVTLADEPSAILERNPQLKKTPGQE